MISTAKYRNVLIEGASALGAITALTGDVTATGPGSVPATLSNTTVAAGTYGNSAQVGQFTVDAKGRLTFAGNVTITPYSPPTYTQGSVLFAGVSGAPTQDNTNFFFDDTTNQLKVGGSVLSPLIIGGTGVTDDLILQATSGVGTTGSWIFFKVGSNGAITTMEMNHLGWVGIGTTGLVALDCGLVVRTANPPDIGIVARFRSNLTAYVSVQSGTGANEHAGFQFSQSTNSVDWRMGVIGNDGDSQRWTVVISGVATNVAYITKTFNFILDSSRSDPGTGSKCLILGDGTAPASLASNTAGVYANDVNGTVNVFAINEAGLSVQLTGPSTIVTTTGNIDDLDFNGSDVIIMNNASLSTIRGLKAGYDGQQVWIVSKGAGEVDFNHQDTNDSTAANRLINNVTVGPTPLAPGTGSACYTYDINTARWRLSFHNQGAFIAIPFSAGDFTANGSMTWTVASGDVAADLFRIEGKTITWLFRYNTTTVGGTLNNTLLKAVPNGYNFLGNGFEQVVYVQDNGTAQSGRAFNNSTTTMGFLLTPAANWQASTDLTKVSGTVVAGLT